MKTIFIALQVPDDTDIFDVAVDTARSFSHLGINEENEPVVYEDFASLATDRGAPSYISGTVEDVTDKIYLREHYGKGESETHTFELCTLFGSALLVDATNKTTGQTAQAFLSLKDVWQQVCTKAAEFADTKEV